MPYTKAMRILSFDPGYERLGVAVLEREQGKEQLLHSDCVQTSKDLSFYERLTDIGNATESIINKWKPDAVALEDLYFNTNQKTAMKVAAVRGVVAFLAKRSGLPVFEYTPAQVKVAVTGYGKSSKEQMMTMVPKLVSIQKEIRFDDEYDAIAVGLTCLACERL